MLKLHLGCGQKYFDGYINIDFPQSKHSVQTKKVADVETDILKLNYKKSSVDEIRLHHVFEHFPRTVALALVGSWNSWLKIGGILRIEVPDFEKSARVFLSPFTQKKVKGVELRHIFGSQEADWAFHYNGWTKGQLLGLMKLSDFKVVKIARFEHKKTYNIEIIAEKISDITKEDFTNKCSDFLSMYLVDNSTSEKSLLAVWQKQLKNQIDLTWAK